MNQYDDNIPITVAHNKLLRTPTVTSFINKDFEVVTIISNNKIPVKIKSYAYKFYKNVEKFVYDSWIVRENQNTSF